MIAALKQYGTNVARNTVKRQVIRFAVLGTLVTVGFVYKLVTGNSITSSDEPSSAAPPPAHAPAHAPAANAAPITAPSQAAPIMSRAAWTARAACRRTSAWSSVASVTS